MKRFLILCIAVLSCGIVNLRAQQTPYPMIGAQIFIEPGQTPADIDRFFSIMKENNMRVGRIRMFGTHMMRPDGSWDYSLYDYAFDAAHRNGVRLFATLFPPTDELNDVGGFKFPASRAHLGEIAEYIRGVVTHFSQKPALYAWVLQNEPGNGSTRFPTTDLSRELYAKWEAEKPAPVYDNGYLKADFSRERFLVYYTNWYLGWIASQVEIYDTEHYKHINPHQIFETLPEYDFRSYSNFLTSMGISMHFSWHFDYFSRQQYPLGISVMADLISGNSLGNPFWITEMQGGSVTASGNVPYCPTGGEIKQFLWTGIGTGAEGIIFWTLNQRAAAMESGEWGLIDFQRQPSDRLRAASHVAGKVEDNKGFFADASPVSSSVTLLYNNESIWTQKRNSQVIPGTRHQGRMASAVMKSLVSAYRALTAYGNAPAVSSMDAFHWQGAPGRVAVIPNMVSLPSRFWDPMRKFVREGGRLVVTGMTGYYDENMYCLYMNGFPLADLFGGSISEFKYIAEEFHIPVGQNGVCAPAHMWKGIVYPEGAQIIALDGEDIVAVHNRFGQGDVVWVPSLINLGGWLGEGEALERFYGEVCAPALENAAVRFSSPAPGVLMRCLENRDSVMTILVNKNPHSSKVELTGSLKKPRTIDGEFNLNGKSVEIPSDSYAVILWKK